MPSPEQYAQMRKRSLQRNRPDLYREFQQAGELQSHLKETGESASAMEAGLLSRMEKKNPLPEDYLERVKELGRRYRQVQEVVMHDLIHEPDAMTAKAMSQGGYLDQTTASLPTTGLARAAPRARSGTISQRLCGRP